jgi:type II secretory ATPase GspE/PulE/Tfp pilus assembly ATPase PilB-like protein
VNPADSVVDCEEKPNMVAVLVQMPMLFLNTPSGERMHLLRQLASHGLVSTSTALEAEASDLLSAWDHVQHLIAKQSLHEAQVLPLLAERYQIELLSDEWRPLWPQPTEEREHLFHQHQMLLLAGPQQQPWVVLSLRSDWRHLNRLRFDFESLHCALTTHATLEKLWQEHSADANKNDPNVAHQWNELLQEALRLRASDIHLEPHDPSETLLVVRLRCDGTLVPPEKLPPELPALLVPHIKLLAGLDIAVKRRPQDGRLQHLASNGRAIDIRLSCLPTERGEKLVLRLLDQAPVQQPLEQLGFYLDDLHVLQQAVQRPQGLILVVGPTGSGKTTTLYALLNLLNAQEQNILTIENPVEYHLPHINQVSVQPAQGLGFAETLRAALRQDPDVILVGEIRDDETAQIAIKAALTGHLVLSTLHTNDAVSTLQRLHNLQVDPSLLADTLLLILSQRLVRRRSGGRTPVYELLRVNDVVQERIRQGKFGADVLAPDERLFFHSLAQTARRLVDDEHVLLEEVRPLLPWE